LLQVIILRLQVDQLRIFGSHLLLELSGLACVQLICIFQAALCPVEIFTQLFDLVVAPAVLSLQTAKLVLDKDHVLLRLSHFLVTFFCSCGGRSLDAGQLGQPLGMAFIGFFQTQLKHALSCAGCSKVLLELGHLLVLVDKLTAKISSSLVKIESTGVHLCFQRCGSFVSVMQVCRQDALSRPSLIKGFLQFFAHPVGIVPFPFSSSKI